MRFQPWLFAGWLMAVCGVALAQAPSIRLQNNEGSFNESSPTRRDGYEGQSLTIAASVTGAQPITYQWAKDGVPIPGAVALTYTFPAVSAADVAAYSLTATNAQGTTVSKSLVLSMAYRRGPIILSHPSSVTVPFDGFAPRFFVSVLGGRSHTFQWKKDGVPISGAIDAIGRDGERTSTLSLPDPLTPAMAGAYSVEITNPDGTVTSRTAYCTVLPPPRPTIAFYIRKRIGPLGQSFRVSASVWPQNAVDSVQWQKDGVDVPGATQTIMEFQGNAGEAGEYRLVATNANGSVTSGPLTIEFEAPRPPEIRIQPGSAKVREGEFYLFSVEVRSAIPVTYQWYHNGQLLVGNTGSSLGFRLNRVTMADAGVYHVVATTAAGTVTSQPGVLEVVAPSQTPILRTVSGSRRVALGTTLEATTGDPGKISLQWFRDGQPMPGETRQYLYISRPAGGMMGTYSVEGRNPAGEVASSGPIRVELEDEGVPPRFVYEWPDVQIRPGSWLSVQVEAQGEEFISYRWFKNGVQMDRSQSLLLSNQNPLDARGSYYVVAANRNGSATSDPFTVTLEDEFARPIFLRQPASPLGVIRNSNEVSLAAPILGGWGLKYQWYKDGQPVGMPNFNDLRLFGDEEVAGRYWVEVSSLGGTVRSDDIVVSLVERNEPPNLWDLTPEMQVAYRGQRWSLTMRQPPSPLGGFTYQWRKDGIPIPGAVNATLSLSHLLLSDTGIYTVIVGDRNGFTSSTAVTLKVEATSPTAPAFAGVYMGTFGTAGSWALNVDYDLTATFLAVMPERNEVILWRNIAVQSSGQIRSLGFSGSLGGGSFLGIFEDNRVPPFTGSRVTAAPYPVRTGFFHTGLPLPSQTDIAAIVSPDGRVLLAELDASGSGRGGLGRVDETGRLVVTTPSVEYRAQLDSVAGMVGMRFPAGDGALPFSPDVIAERLKYPGKLVNLSTRGVVRGGEGLLIAGFVISGAGPRDVLVRAAGPALSDYQITSWLPDPRLRVVSQGGVVMAENDNWDQGGGVQQLTDAMGRTGAFPFQANMRDAALRLRLMPGVYTALVEASGNQPGVALVEVYEDAIAGGDEAKLVNLSTRGNVGTGEDILIVGLNLRGIGPRKVLIRVAGPALTKQGVTNVLANPELAVYRGSTKILENDNWSANSEEALVISATAAKVGAFDFTWNSRDAALLAELPAGAYTVHAKGVNDTTGIALVELYEVP